MKTLMLNRLRFSLILLALLIVASHGLFAQLRVTKITTPEMLAGKKGIVYTLPRTQIHVELWITKTQQVPGPLSEFASEYLGLKDVITERSISYSISDAAIHTSADPDPDQVYLIEKEEKSSGEIWISFGTSTPVLALEKFDKTATPENFVKWNNDLFITPDPGQLFRKYSESPTREMVDTIIRKISIDTLVLEEKYFKHYRVEYTDREKAQEAAGRIAQIDEDKYKLLTGYQETAYSKESLEFMYNKLEEERIAYLELFTGNSINETLKFDYQVIPVVGREEQVYRLAGFAKNAGLTSPESQNGITLSLEPDPGKDLKPVPVEGQLSTGIAYRLPKSVRAVLTLQEKQLVSKHIDVLQLGTIFTLPPEFKRIDFDSETGEVKSVVLE